MDPALAGALVWGALFLLVFADSAMLLHLVPSLPLIAAAILLVATDPARRVAAIIVMTLAGLLGTSARYAVARWGGLTLLLRHRRIFHVNENWLARIEPLFATPIAESLMFLLRLVPFLRVVVALPAGLASMDWRRYLLYTAPGIALFEGALAWATYTARSSPLLARALSLGLAWSARGWPIVVLAIALLVGAAWLLRRERAHVEG